MEGKWIAILAVGMSIAMFGPLAFMEYSKGQCRIEAIKAGMSPEAIAKVCQK